MVGIIDYGSGNLRSVYNAFRYLGADVKVCDNPRDLERADKIVLPGVGSSKDALRGLRSRDITGVLMESMRRGKLFLGICLGLQMLFERSEESGGSECLKIMKGEVKRFPCGRGLKVPQIGWNTVNRRGRECPIFKGVDDGSYFYFVHSFYCESGDSAAIAGETEYGITYTSVLWKDNVYAVQFHPERSQKNGLKILENFVKL